MHIILSINGNSVEVKETQTNNEFMGIPENLNLRAVQINQGGTVFASLEVLIQIAHDLVEVYSCSRNFKSNKLKKYYMAKKACSLIGRFSQMDINLGWG